MLKVAIAKGRIAEKVQELLDKTEYYGGLIDLDSRKLIFRDEERQIEFILVKPVDLPVYVENGAADVGIVGKDVLMEGGHSICEILDLGISSCKISVAGLPENRDNVYPIRRIATKYPRITKEFFQKKTQQIEIIKLNGSVELAPIMGLSDAIVDVVESGATLRENGLIVYEDICNVSARVIANKISYKLKNKAVSRLANTLEAMKEVR